MKTSFIYKSRIIQHLVFWFLILVFFSVLNGFFVSDKLVVVKFELSSMILAISVTYFTIYYLIPNYLLKDKITSFLVLFIILAIITGFLERAYFKYALLPIFRPEQAEAFKVFNYQVTFAILGNFSIVVLASSIKLIKNWLISKNEQLELKNQVVKSELALMKSQIHPHFLFNTINNIYSLSLKKSDLAPDMLLKLSELMRYMLYECNVPLIELDKELSYLENYISLERIRYGERLNLSFNIQGKNKGELIPPLILLPFIENCFKHGVSKKRDSILININIDIIGDRLKMIVENSKPLIEKETDEDYSEGIGLKNVIKRLDLIYKDNYTLKIDNLEDKFYVRLNIKLNYIQDNLL